MAASPAPEPAVPIVAVQQATGGECTFVLGFAALRSALGPQRVGDCLENEREVPGNGNQEQLTTRGLMVWRRIDNWMAFTDGATTWVNGPAGVVSRPNDSRFPWEGDRQAIEALRRGGHVVYFRHGATDRSQQDTDHQNLANCATQRNLNEAGRAQGQAIGEAFRALAIPVGPVLSSEYCRALEFARLAFGTAEPNRSLLLLDPLPQAVRQQQAVELRALIAAPPPPGVNTILVGHQPNLIEAMDVNLGAEGAASVFRPTGQGGATETARFLAQEWGALARALRS